MELQPDTLIPITVDEERWQPVLPSSMDGVSAEEFAVSKQDAFEALSDALRHNIDAHVLSQAQGEHQKD